MPKNWNIRTTHITHNRFTFIVCIKIADSNIEEMQVMFWSFFTDWKRTAKIWREGEWELKKNVYAQKRQRSGNIEHLKCCVCVFAVAFPQTKNKCIYNSLVYVMCVYGFDILYYYLKLELFTGPFRNPLVRPVAIAAELLVFFILFVSLFSVTEFR